MTLVLIRSWMAELGVLHLAVKVNWQSEWLMDVSMEFNGIPSWSGSPMSIEYYISPSDSLMERIHPGTSRQTFTNSNACFKDFKSVCVCDLMSWQKLAWLLCSCDRRGQPYPDRCSGGGFQCYYTQAADGVSDSHTTTSGLTRVRSEI